MSDTATGLDAARIRRWCGFALAAQLAAIVFIVLGTHGLIVPLRDATTTDFVSFYAAGTLANGADPASVYNRALHFAAERAATAPTIHYVFFFYPPVFLLLCALLAHLPYLTAFVLFETVSTAGLLAVLAAILRPADRLWLLPVLSFSPLLWAIGVGQNSCMTAALFGAGCLLLQRRRDLCAGLVFSALLCKPHMGLLLPLALVAGGRWRAVFGAAAGTVALVASSLVCFGAAPWMAFDAALFRASAEFASAQVVPFSVLASSFGAVRLLGFGATVATVAEIVIDLLVAVCVWRSWRERSAAAVEQQFALLVTGTLLVMPVVLFYDTTLLLVAGAWLCRAGACGATVRTRWLASAWVLGLIAYPLARALHLPLSMLSVALCFAASLPVTNRRSLHLPLTPSA